MVTLQRKKLKIDNNWILKQASRARDQQELHQIYIQILEQTRHLKRGVLHILGMEEIRLWLLGKVTGEDMKDLIRKERISQG